MAFARGLIAAYELNSIATLPHSHGLTDTSAATATVSRLTLRIGQSGTFQRFNDVVARLNRLPYVNRESHPDSLAMPAAPSHTLRNLDLSLKDILARIPEIRRLYRDTFDESAKTESFSLHRLDWHWQLRIDDRRIYASRDDLVDIVRNWRARFPALSKWRVVEATRAWGNSIIMFANLPVPTSELDEATLGEYAARFVVPYDLKSEPQSSLADVLSPSGGSFSGHTSFISPIVDTYLSEYSLHYLAMYLLSSLVRYPTSDVGSFNQSECDVTEPGR